MPDVYVVAKPGILEIPEFFSESRNFSDISFFTDICKNNSGISSEFRNFLVNSGFHLKNNGIPRGYYFFFEWNIFQKKIIRYPINCIYNACAREGRGGHAFVLLVPLNVLYM